MQVIYATFALVAFLFSHTKHNTTTVQSSSNEVQTTERLPLAISRYWQSKIAMLRSTSITLTPTFGVFTTMKQPTAFCQPSYAKCPDGARTVLRAGNKSSYMS